MNVTDCTGCSKNIAINDENKYFLGTLYERRVAYIHLYTLRVMPLHPEKFETSAPQQTQTRAPSAFTILTPFVSFLNIVLVTFLV